MDPLDNARTMTGEAAARQTPSLHVGADFGQYALKLLPPE